MLFEEGSYRAQGTIKSLFLINAERKQLHFKKESATTSSINTCYSNDSSCFTTSRNFACKAREQPSINRKCRDHF